LISLVANAWRASFRPYRSTSLSRKAAQKSRTQIRKSRSGQKLLQRSRSFSRYRRMRFSTGGSRSSVAVDAPSRRRAFAEMRSQKRIDPFLAFHNEARPNFWTLRRLLPCAGASVVRQDRDIQSATRYRSKLGLLVRLEFHTPRVGSKVAIVPTSGMIAARIRPAYQRSPDRQMAVAAVSERARSAHRDGPVECQSDRGSPFGKLGWH
jgi:hypothetical protein